MGCYGARLAGVSLYLHVKPPGPRKPGRSPTEMFASESQHRYATRDVNHPATTGTAKQLDRISENARGRWRWTRRLAIFCGVTGLALQLAIGLCSTILLPAPNPGVAVMSGSIITCTAFAIVGASAGIAADVLRRFVETRRANSILDA